MIKWITVINVSEMIQPVPKLMILDGNSIVNRAFYGIRLLTNSEGLYTNAVYGFLNILFKYLDEETPEYLCVAFDLHAPTFRHKKYSLYKANRKGMPDELRQQMPLLKEVLGAMNIPMLSLEGYEADDLIGTVSRKCEEQGMRCVILTGDRDDLQLASESTVIKLVTTKGGATQTVDYDYDVFFSEYGITPKSFIDVKGLMGDSSDNIPGVPGIGEKTAFSLIQHYSSIEKIYDGISDEFIKPALRNKLESGRESAILSRELATIDRFVPVDINLSEWIIKEYDNDKLSALFLRLNFQSFIKRLKLTMQSPSIEVSGNSQATVRNILNGKAMYFAHYNDEIAVASSENDIAEVDEKQLSELLNNPEIKKIGHDLKSDMVKYGVFCNVAFDTMIAAYIDNPSISDYDIELIAGEKLGQSGLDSAPKRVNAVIGLYKLFAKKIEELCQHELFYDIELPLVTVLADMQLAGVLVDKAQLENFRELLSDRISTLEQEIYSHAGGEFNINSPKQLGVVLFEKLRLPIVKKTKSGYSTNAEVLEKLTGEHPVIELISQYRLVAKLKSTYADGLLSVINPKTGRIHSNFNQTVTVTGRISSTEPNLQNIPVRTELGRELRKMFVAPDGCLLADADYSQIELRVLAHIAQDDVMTDAFKSDSDIHAATASQIFGVPQQSVTGEMRSRAKTINFGIVYGMGEFSLAKDLHISVFEARQYIKNYFERFSGVKKYMNETVEKARDDGYVTTLLNRRRYLPEISAGNFITRAFGERVAMNTPIQGSAADIIKLAMVKVYKRLTDEGLKSRLVLQVHDELIIETHKSEAETVKQILKTEMENAYSLCVPLKVDMNVGDSWYEAK